MAPLLGLHDEPLGDETLDNRIPSAHHRRHMTNTALDHELRILGEEPFSISRSPES